MGRVPGRYRAVSTLAFFGLDDAKAAAIDPQHRLLLETSWEAIEQAGIAPSSLSGSMTGVYLGLSHDDYMRITLEADEYGFTGLASAMASGSGGLHA